MNQRLSPLALTHTNMEKQALSLAKSVGKAAWPAVKNYGKALGSQIKGQIQGTGAGVARNLSGVPARLKDTVDPAKLSPFRQGMFERANRWTAAQNTNIGKWDDYVRTGFDGTQNAGWMGARGIKTMAGMPAWAFNPSMLKFTAGTTAATQARGALDRYKSDQIMGAHQQYADLPFMDRMGVALSPDAAVPTLLNHVNPNQYARLIREGRINPRQLQPMVDSGQLNAEQIRDIINQLQ